MEIVTNIYEQTTAFTDFILGIISVLLFLTINRAGRNVDKIKTRVWGSIYICIAISSFLGGIVHGLVISALVYEILWSIIFLCSGFLISFLGVGALYDFYRSRLPMVIYWLAGGFSILFFLLNLYGPDTFIFFIGYEMLILIGALYYYNRIYRKAKMKWTFQMLLGIGLSIIAAVLQTIDSIRITLIWDFNNNGVFHLIEMFALFSFASGVLGELRFQKQQKERKEVI